MAAPKAASRRISGALPVTAKVAISAAAVAAAAAASSLKVLAVCRSLSSASWPGPQQASGHQAWRLQQK
jgi:hypothetical protein